MQQTFVKTIQSKQVEFSRLLFPIRYKVFVRIENMNPAIAVIQKNENQQWYMNSQDNASEWLAQMEEELVKSIEENELKNASASV